VDLPDCFPTNPGSFVFGYPGYIIRKRYSIWVQALSSIYVSPLFSAFALFLACLNRALAFFLGLLASNTSSNSSRLSCLVSTMKYQIVTIPTTSQAIKIRYAARSQLGIRRFRDFNLLFQFKAANAGGRPKVLMQDTADVTQP
jgi:hypothetical protein